MYYFKDGLDENAEKTNFVHDFKHKKGVVDDSFHPYQIRMISPGYYVEYQQKNDGSDDNVPSAFLMEAKKNGSKYTAKYMLPNL